MATTSLPRHVVRATSKHRPRVNQQPCLPQDAVHRAVQKDEEGNTAAALKIYQVALDACAEGLQLNAPDTGVDPANSNVGKWRREMQTWADSIRNRMRVLQSQGASSSSTPGVPADLAQAGRSPRWHPQQHQHQGGSSNTAGNVSRTTSADASALQQHAGGEAARKRVAWSKEEER